MKMFFFIAFTAAFVCVCAADLAHAETILDQSNIGDRGNVDGGCWALSDGGFSISGDAFGQTMYIESVTFWRDAEAPDGTAGELFLKVFSGNTGGAGIFVGASNNTVDFLSLGEGEAGTWNFGGLAIDKDAVYSYVEGTTNDGSNPDAKIRMKLSDGSNPLTSGGAIINDAIAWGGSWDPTVRIVASVPEPGMLCLLAAVIIAGAFLPCRSG